MKKQLQEKAGTLDRRITELESLREQLLPEQEAQVAKLLEDHAASCSKADQLERRLLLLENSNEAKQKAKKRREKVGNAADFLAAAENSQQELNSLASSLMSRLTTMECKNNGPDSAAERGYEDIDGRAVDLEKRLAFLEKKAADHKDDIEAKSDELIARLDALESDRLPKDAKEISLKAEELGRRLSMIEASGTKDGVNVAEFVAPLEAKIKAQQDIIARLQTQASVPGPPDQELVGRLRAVESERNGLQEITNQLNARLAALEASSQGERAIQPEGVPIEIHQALQRELVSLKEAPPAPPILQGIPMETHEALRREFETLKQAGVSVQDFEALKVELTAQQEEAAVAKQQADMYSADVQRLAMQIQVLQNQSPPRSPQARDALSPNNADMDAQLEAVNQLLNRANIEKMELTTQLSDLQDQANAKILAAQAEQEAAIAQAREQRTKAQSLEQQVIELSEELSKVYGLQEQYAVNEKNLTAQIVELQQALDSQGKSPPRDPRVEQLQLEVQAKDSQINQYISTTDALQGQLSHIQAIYSEAEHIKNEQEQQINSLTDQLNQVLIELDSAKKNSQSSASVEEVIAAERQTHSLKLKAMEEKQDMLTKEFEAEYTEIRRKEAQIGRKYEEEKMRADNEATNSRALIEEKQQLLVQVEQLKVKLLEQGNSANSHLQMEQRVREYEQLLSQQQAESRQALEQARAEARLNAQTDSRTIQELQLKLQRVQAQTSSGQVNQAVQEELLQAAQNKAEEYYQQVLRLNAANDQLKAEQAYLVKEIESKNNQPRDVGTGASSDQTLAIKMLSEENGDLKTQLAQTWAKINEQTKKIEEERSAFWEELEAVRLKSTDSPPNRMPGMPLGVAPMAGVPSTMPSKPSSPPTATGGFAQQQQQAPAGISRQPAGRPGEVKLPSTRQAPSGGVGIRPVPPSRTGASLGEQRTAMPGAINNARGLSYGNPPITRENLPQPISTGQMAPSRR